MPERNHSGSRDRFRRRVDAQVTSVSRLFGRERRDGTPQPSSHDDRVGAVAVSSLVSMWRSTRRSSLLGQEHQPRVSSATSLNTRLDESTAAKAPSALVDTCGRSGPDPVTPAEDTRTSYWQQAALKLENDKPEIKASLATLLSTGNTSSARLATKLQAQIKAIAQTLEEREFSLPFKIRVKAAKVRRHMNVVMKSILAFKDCINLVARLDPHGAAPFVWGGVSTFLQVRPCDSDDSSCLATSRA